MDVSHTKNYIYMAATIDRNCLPSFGLLLSYGKTISADAIDFYIAQFYLTERSFRS